MLALGTASRAQTLAAIERDNVKETKEGLEIRIMKGVWKHIVQGKLDRFYVYQFFKEKPELCIAYTDSVCE